MTTANYHPDTSRPPDRFDLDLSDKPTNEQVITREDWATIPGLLGLPEVDTIVWSVFGPGNDQEFVKRHDGWFTVWTRTGERGSMVTFTTAFICDLAIPLLTTCDSRLPEVGE